MTTEKKLFVCPCLEITILMWRFITICFPIYFYIIKVEYACCVLLLRIFKVFIFIYHNYFPILITLNDCIQFHHMAFQNFLILVLGLNIFILKLRLFLRPFCCGKFWELMGQGICIMKAFDHDYQVALPTGPMDSDCHQLHNGVPSSGHHHQFWVFSW